MPEQLANGVTTNGDTPHSQFLDHLTSYPIVSDGIATYKSHPYGQKSLSLANDLYTRFAHPLLPYLQTPYSYLAPYLARADALGDSSLASIDSRFPALKSADTQEVKSKAFELAGLPVRYANEGRTYLWGTWQDEYGKTKGEGGVVRGGKALVSTELKVLSDVMGWVARTLNKGKEEGKKVVNEKAQQ